MKSNMTRSEFDYNMKIRYPGENKAVVDTVVSILGVEFKKEIDWEAETHDPSVIPKNWLAEMWDNGKAYRWVGLLPKCRDHAYDNYRAIKKEDWPKWAIEAHKSLED